MASNPLETIGNIEYEPFFDVILETRRIVFYFFERSY